MVVPGLGSQDQAVLCSPVLAEPRGSATCGCCCSTEKCVLHTFSQFGHQTVDTLSEETEASIVSILLQRIPSVGVWQTSLASRITCCQGREMAVICKAVH